MEERIRSEPFRGCRHAILTETGYGNDDERKDGDGIATC